METLIPINVIIGDRSYRIRIEPKDEETVRKKVKAINDKVIEFKTLFAGKDMQDYVSMVVLWYATLRESAIDQPQEDNNSDEKIMQLEVLLDKVLQK
jgi:hypothetical protein